MSLDEAIKYYSYLADECRRKADIERNDYMDLKDLTAECEQLANWLNELKVLREKIQKLLEKQEQDRWIPVKEHEPTETGLYLVTETTVVERKWTTRIRVARCDVTELKDGRIDVCWRGYGGNVLAWMPLPDPYREEEL